LITPSKAQTLFSKTDFAQLCEVNSVVLDKLELHLAMDLGNELIDLG
jgi:hypothetical protein